MNGEERVKKNLLNEDYISHFITTNDKEPVKYRWSHGATDLHLGDGLVIYSLIQFFRAKTCVCIGTGGGFIPRIMTQAREDLHSQKIFEGSGYVEWGDIGTTIIVDANNSVGGTTDWTDKNSFLRKHFNPRIILDTSENAYYNFFVKEGIQIDFLHIDGDHSYEGVKKDFELYSRLVTKNGIVSIHDTDRTYSTSHLVTNDLEGIYDNFYGPADFLDKIELNNWQRLDLFNHVENIHHPTSTGLTLLKKLE